MFRTGPVVRCAVRQKGPLNRTAPNPGITTPARLHALIIHGTTAALSATPTTPNCHWSACHAGGQSVLRAAPLLKKFRCWLTCYCLALSMLPYPIVGTNDMEIWNIYSCPNSIWIPSASECVCLWLPTYALRTGMSTGMSTTTGHAPSCVPHVQSCASCIPIHILFLIIMNIHLTAGWLT